MEDTDRTGLGSVPDVRPTGVLVAVVRTAPVPDIPLAALLPRLEPIASGEGGIADWRFHVEGLDDAATLREYQAWRASWERTWDLGPISNVASFALLAAISEGGAATELITLLNDMVGDPGRARLDPAAAEPVLTALDSLRARLAASPATGMGIVDETPRHDPPSGFALTWAVPAEPNVLAADDHVAVLEHPTDGLVLDDTGSGRRLVTDINLVDLTGEQVFVKGADGVFGFQADEVRPLGWVLPGALTWRVRPIPLVTVWSRLFMRLPAAVDAATTAHSAVTFRALDPFT